MNNQFFKASAKAANEGYKRGVIASSKIQFSFAKKMKLLCLFTCLIVGFLFLTVGVSSFPEKPRQEDDAGVSFGAATQNQGPTVSSVYCVK